jgi:O-antigen ligase
MDTTALALAVGSFVVMTAIFYSRQNFGLAVIVFLLPFEWVGSYSLSGEGSHVIRLVQIAGAALIAAIFLEKAWRAKLWLPKLPLPLGLFLISTLVSAALINSPRVWQNYLWALFVAALFAAVAKTVQSHDLRLPSKALVTSSTLVSIYGLYQFISSSIGLPSEITGLRPGYSPAVLGYPRIHSVAIEPLNFANYLMIPLLLMIAFWIVRGGRLRPAGYAAFGVICLAFLLTTSRGAFIAFVPGIVILALILRRQIWRPRWPLVIGVVLAAGATAVVLLGLASARTRGSALAGPKQFAEMVSTKFTDNASYRERELAAQQARAVFNDRPWLGYGLGKAGGSQGASPQRSAYENLNPMSSGWEMLLEAGLIGTFFFVWFLLYLWWRGVRAITFLRQPRTIAWVAGLTAATIAITIQALSFSAFYISYIWVSLGLLYGLSRRAEPKSA